MIAIDSDALTTELRRALPDSEPSASVPMFVAQVPWPEADAGIQLLERVCDHAHPAAWRFDEALLETWPGRVVSFAMHAVRALPPGEERIRGLMQVPARLTSRESDEVMPALVDGTFPQTVWAPHTKPTSRRNLIVSFVRTVSPEQRERWFQFDTSQHEHSPLLYEFRSRKAVDCLSEASMRDLWARIPAHNQGEIPQEFPGWSLAFSGVRPPGYPAGSKRCGSSTPNTFEECLSTRGAVKVEKRRSETRSCGNAPAYSTPSARPISADAPRFPERPLPGPCP